MVMGLLRPVILVHVGFVSRLERGLREAKEMKVVPKRFSYESE